MKVKHLIRELQKCNPEYDVIMETDGPYCTWAVDQDYPGGEDPCVTIFASDPNPDAANYNNSADTPQPYGETTEED